MCFGVIYFVKKVWSMCAWCASGTIGEGARWLCTPVSSTGVPLGSVGDSYGVILLPTQLSLSATNTHWT